MVCLKTKRFQNSIYNFESTVNSKYVCLCKVFLFVLKESLVWSISILLYLGWQPCKDEGIFPLRTAAQTACSSLHVRCAQEGRFRSALPGLLRSKFCTGLVTDPLLSDIGRQEQVPGEHCLLLMEDYEQAIQSTSQPGCQCACKHFPVCDGISESYSHRSLTPGLFVNFRSM